ncbi:CIC11C00000000610 [Sungouiella intermedia]|uniref:Non-structural maintenance of chromosomes element 1 homolog n=1 Tax=Sungouiella intermedia TaxID=45354 RepID=A0A1L0CV18_9ASCO|nr:CIC11C00000000610 [[Candida] intermedia]
MASSITECHRVLLTFIRTRKIVLEDEMDTKFPILISHFGLDSENPSLLREYISTINVALEKHAFKIETIRDQESRKLQYVFINTRFDDVIQGCTPYTPPELDAIKQVIDEIINASNFSFCFPQGNAKQLVGSTLKQRASDATYFVARLVDDGWIEITQLNRLVLAPASLAELKEYLADRFGYFLVDDLLGKLLVCHTCGDLVTLGVKCKSRDCGSSFHKKCAEVYMRSNDGCPSSSCSDTLEDMVKVGP